MKPTSKSLTYLALGILITSFLIINAQKQNKHDEEPDVNQFPILDYKKSGHSGDGIKRAKSKKYDNRYAVRISESSDGIFTISDWEVGLSALPVSRSSAVILGEVTNAQAHLSDDETNIYSEFTVRLVEILKHDRQRRLNIGDDVIVERSGGRVRLPSGKVIVSRTNHQDLPHVGKSYLLFLTHAFAGGSADEDFHILTGYELRNGQVFPLDKLNRGHAITQYSGADLATFRADLSKGLANPSFPQSR